MAPPNPDEHTMDRHVGAGNGWSGIDIALHPTQSGFMKRPSWEQQTARKAGFSYPEGEMTCSSRCEQRWAKE